MQSLFRSVPRRIACPPAVQRFLSQSENYFLNCVIVTDDRGRPCIEWADTEPAVMSFASAPPDASRAAQAQPR